MRGAPCTCLSMRAMQERRVPDFARTTPIGNYRRLLFPFGLCGILLRRCAGRASVPCTTQSVTRCVRDQEAPSPELLARMRSDADGRTLPTRLRAAVRLCGWRAQLSMMRPTTRQHMARVARLILLVGVFLLRPLERLAFHWTTICRVAVARRHCLLLGLCLCARATDCVSASPPPSHLRRACISPPVSAQMRLHRLINVHARVLIPLRRLRTLHCIGIRALLTQVGPRPGVSAEHDVSYLRLCGLASVLTQAIKITVRCHLLLVGIVWLRTTSR